MSDTAEDPDFQVEHLLNKSKTRSLRERMREFVAEHDGPADLKQLREDVADGDDLSDIVVEDRDERL